MLWLARFGMVIAAVLATALPAAALDLDTAKRQGLIGERPDGYVEVVDPNASPDVRAFAAEVNAKRRDAYQKVARQNGAPLADVAKIAGKKLIDGAPPGTYVKIDGEWVKKR
ncbi:MAG TPA: YdbL family protein [Candidatus Limnocylindria bacterium]|nr:YdbL family protein [Candidatus Limnocylindria bacterium]